MIRLSFSNSSYNRVAEIYRMLDTIGVEVMILPTIDSGKEAFLLVPKNEMKKASEAFKRLDIEAKEKEVLILNLENRIGEIADVSRKIKDRGISINHASLVPQSIIKAFLILECSDNKAALMSV
jgi:hypothetical protein